MLRTLRLFTEWGISLKFKQLKSKLWFNVFLQVAVIFAAFVAVLMLCNASMLSQFFCLRQKNALAAQLNVISDMNINDTDEVSETLTDISENYNFDVEIYDALGNIKYTTQRGHIMDYFFGGRQNFRASHDSFVTVKSEELADGAVFEEAVRLFDNKEYLLCRKQIENGLFAEVKIQKELILIPM